MRAKFIIPTVMSLILAAGLVAGLSSPVAAASETVTINRYDHGAVVATRTVTWDWMKDNLPVQGDGITHYWVESVNWDCGGYGPDRPFDRLWNVDETTTYSIDNNDFGAAMGTDAKDLCDLVGPVQPGSTIKFTAIDNFRYTFDYENIYNPDPRQGKFVLAWYTTAPVYPNGYVPSYSDGLRLMWFTTVPDSQGRYVYGNYDMYLTRPENYWSLAYGSGDLWPRTDSASVYWVSRIDIYPPTLISCAADGNAKDYFLPGETVYVKGRGLTANRTYNLWIQPEPAVFSPVPGNNEMLNNLPGATHHGPMDAANDPSGSQESVTTDANGDFDPVAIWDIDPAAAVEIYDIVADNQGAGTVGAFDTKDGADSPGFEGFAVVNPTYDSLGSLVEQVVTKKGIVNSLLKKLENAKKAESKGNANAKAGLIGAFINEVEAQSGKAISAEDAATLIALANRL